MKTINFGEHLTIDGYKGDLEKLNNKKLVEEALNELPEILKMKKLSEPQVYFASENDKKDPGGWSGFVIISESHISIHTFPRRGFVSADVYSCKNGMDREIIKKYFMEKFGLKKIEEHFILRGTEYPKINIYQKIMKKRLRVLFISGELIAGDLAYRLKKEGCDVKMYIEEKPLKSCFDGMVEKTTNWKKKLGWVGKDGLIVFDDVGYGMEQKKLREKGYLAVGGGFDGDKLELNRVYGQEILKLYGVIDGNFKTQNFTVDSAIKYVKKNKGEWVIKQNDHNTALNYIGSFDDGSDVISILENYKSNFGGLCSVSLQKRVRGVEIAIGRFFNGNDWVGPSVINFEHKHLNNDDIGPLGGETGTLMWYEEDENNKLFKKTLNKIKPHLKNNNYVGYIDINCIVNKDIVFPLEITSRFGSSTIETQSELQISLWKDFLFSLAKKEKYKLNYKKEYGICVALTVPPFPYRTKDRNIINSGVNVIFKKEISEKDMSHVHFENIKKIKNTYLTEGDLGYVLYITGSG